MHIKALQSDQNCDVRKHSHILNDIIETNNITSITFVLAYTYLLRNFSFEHLDGKVVCFCDGKSQIKALQGIFDKKIKSICASSDYEQWIKPTDGVYEYIFSSHDGLSKFQSSFPETLKYIYIPCGTNWIHTIKSNVKAILDLPVTTCIVMYGLYTPENKDKYRPKIYRIFKDNLGKQLCNRIFFCRECPFLSDFSRGIRIYFF